MAAKVRSSSLFCSPSKSFAKTPSPLLPPPTSPLCSLSKRFLEDPLVCVLSLPPLLKACPGDVVVHVYALRTLPATLAHEVLAEPAVLTGLGQFPCVRVPIKGLPLTPATAPETVVLHQAAKAKAVLVRCI